METISNGLMGASFDYAGSRIAPDNRKIVAYVLTFCTVLVAGFLLFGAADAVVYATGKDQNGEVVTGDADLKDLPGVVYIASPQH